MKLKTCQIMLKCVRTHESRLYLNRRVFVMIFLYYMQFKIKGLDTLDNLLRPFFVYHVNIFCDFMYPFLHNKSHFPKESTPKGNN